MLAPPIIPATALALTQPSPIGRGQGTTLMAHPIHIRFDQHGLDPVARLPIATHLPQHQPVTLGGQIAHAQLAPNQEARQADNLPPVLLAGLEAPANPLIPTFQMKGRRSKPKGSHNPGLTLHQITQLRAHQRTAAQRMLPHDQPIPNPVRRIVFIRD